MSEEKDDHWMEKAFKPSTKGALHKQLGVKTGKKIPAGKLKAAASGKDGKKAKKRAVLAETAKRVNEKRERK